MKTIQAFAPAKINLFLHVGGLGADGYHPLTSWMVFADVGDRLTLTPDAEMKFAVEGPFTKTLPPGRDNIVVRARDRVLAAARIEVAPFSLMLDKQLPVASGMGGGSSDAAATLRAVGAVADIAPEILEQIARDLGSDVPACLRASSLMARGRGEVMSPAPAIPPLPAVLVNPGVAVSTREVFAAFDAGPPGDLSDGHPPTRFSNPEEVAAYLASQRNDLAAAALSTQPIIGEALALLDAAPETLLARMSGSGATVFALCVDAESAARLTMRIAAQRPDWWVRACRLS